MKKIYVILFFVAAFAVSCKKEDNQSGVFDGPKTTLYSGKAWTRVQLDAAGKPMQAAIVLDDAAINSVPVGANLPEGEASLSFDVRAANLPFTHAVVNWNPNGHDPFLIYGRPHFDFHFYMIDEAERMMIPIYTADSVKFKTGPAPAYLPPNYINPGGGLEHMGAHWVDATSPELSQTNPQVFTQAFVYGTYNGKVIFYEPMITLDFLKATTSFERAIPQPSKFQVSGYFPNKAKVIRHDGVTEVIVDGFEAKQAS